MMEKEQSILPKTTETHKDDGAQVKEATAAGEKRVAVTASDDASATSLDKQSFPEKLMYLLDSRIDPAAFWWNESGTSFGMDTSKKFCDNVDALFPGKIKLESFIRKLNRWGFRRVPGVDNDPTVPRNAAHYKCIHFQRGKPELMKNMKYQPGGSRPRKKPRPSEVPHFSPSRHHLGGFGESKSDATHGTRFPSAAAAAAVVDPSSYNTNSLLEAARRRADIQESASSPLQSLMNLQLQQIMLQQRFGLSAAAMAGSSASNGLLSMHNPLPNAPLSSLGLGRGGSSGLLPSSEQLSSHHGAGNNMNMLHNSAGLSNAAAGTSMQHLSPNLVNYLLQRGDVGLSPDPRVVELLVEQDRARQQQEQQQDQQQHHQQFR